MIPSPPLGTDAAAGLVGPGATTGAGPGGAVAERKFRFELAAHPGSPAQARRLARARLTGWAVCEDTCDTAALVVSELVTNAIVHTASSRVVCELRDGGELVRIAVHDEGCAPGEPHPSPQRPEEEHGRGLLLVDALCRAWGAQEDGPGLVVWAELARGAAAPRNAHGVANDRREPYGTHEYDDRPGSHKARDGQQDPYEARGDLGWGARPKPGPPRAPSDEDATQAHHRAAVAVGHQAHRSDTGTQQAHHGDAGILHALHGNTGTPHPHPHLHPHHGSAGTPHPHPTDQGDPQAHQGTGAVWQ
ncbi:ATP-binding protein [Streptomyces sp. NPDC020801]|uniref:ATP-binding protein n=1 Tax=unclassified Streptomyces TaxID=2593676 RepID=UPI0037BC0BFD